MGHLVDESSVYAFLATHRERLFPDELFADLFPSRRSRPSVPAPVAATVMVLQSLEGLSDRDAMERLRCDIRWKVAAGLALDHEGFHPTTLTYWRSRLRSSDRPERIFDAVRDVIVETGTLARSTRRALDSTVLDDAVATQDTVTQLVGQIRRVRRQVLQAAAVEVVAHDYTQAGKPACDWRDRDARDQLITALVTDARAILEALELVPLDEGQAEAVGLLALVAGQDVEEGDTPGSWRIARRTVPDRVVSTVDPVIVAAALTAGNVPDGPTGVDLLEEERDPVGVLADSAYGSGEVRAALADNDHVQFIKPIPLRPSTDAPDAFTIDDFGIDLAAGTVSCPGQHTVPISSTGRANFGRRCTDCPLRSRCTAAKRGKVLKVHPHHDKLAAARRDATDPAWQATYQRHRPMVERTIAWLVARGHRRAASAASPPTSSGSLTGPPL